MTVVSLLGLGIISMDLSKAFDLIQYPLLLSELNAYGSERCKLSFISQGRYPRVKPLGPCAPAGKAPVRRGVPQAGA